MRGPSPLLRAAPGRVFAEPLRGLLLVAVFAMTAAATVSEPLYLQHAGNAAFDQARQNIQPSAAEGPDDIVRLVFPGTPSEPVIRKLLGGLARLPQLGPVELSAGSIARELDTSAVFESVVSTGGRQRHVRLFSVDHPEQRLRIAGRAPTTAGGVWLPVPVARALAATVGRPVTFSITAPDGKRDVTRSIRAPLAGTYDIDRATSTPLDPSGSTLWADRRGELPTESLARTNALLLVADPSTAVVLARATHDQLQWVAQRRLLAATTLAQADEAARGIAAFDARVQVLPASVTGPTPLRIQVHSGVPLLTAPAHDEVAATAGPVRSLAFATTALGLVALFGITALTVRRRRDELRHAAFLGMSPWTLAAHGAAECVLPLLVAASSVALVGAGVSSQLGTPYLNGLRVTAAVCGIALLLIGVTTAVAARVWSNPEVGATASVRGRAVVPSAIAAGLGAVVISLYGNHDASVSSWLTLLVPMVTLLAVGALAGYVVTGVAARGARRLEAGVPTSAPIGFAARLALRRLASGGLLVVLIVAGLTTSLGMLLFARVSTTATDRAVADRTAVAVGARTAVTIDGSSLLDPSAPPAVPGARGHDPRPPAGATLVWNTEIGTLDEIGPQQLLAVSPATFDPVASWGTGRQLAQARTDTAAFIRGPASTSRKTVPVLAVGLGGLLNGTSFSSQLGVETVTFRVVGHVALFPGLRFGLVTTSAALFPALHAYDPRLAPPKPLSATQYSGFTTAVWSRHDLDDVRRQLSGVEIMQVSTAAEIADSPLYRSARDAVEYRELLTLFLVVLGTAGVVLFVERTAASARVSELMLVVAGLRASGALTARLLEITGWIVAAAVGALASVGVLSNFSARLLEFAAADPPPLYVRVGGVDLLDVLLGAVVGAAALLATVAWTTRRRVALEALRGE